MRWLVGIGLAALLSASPARAAPQLHTVARGLPTGVVTDGARYAVFSAASGATTVFDTRTGTQRVLRLTPGCRPEDGSAGYFLLNCPGPFGTTRPYVLRAQLGTVFKVPGDPSVFDELFFSSIGKRWLGGYEEHGVTAVYMDWRTGREGDYGEDLGTQVPRDLDAPGLSPLPHSSRALVASFGGYQMLRSGPGIPDFRTLILRHRGRRTVTLDGCYPGGCAFPSLGPKLALWTRGTSVRAYVLRSGHRARWTFAPSLRYSAGPFVASQTATRVFFNIALGSGPQTTHLVLGARVPR